MCEITDGIATGGMTTEEMTMFGRCRAYQNRKPNRMPMVESITRQPTTITVAPDMCQVIFCHI